MTCSAGCEFEAREAGSLIPEAARLVWQSTQIHRPFV
jgi:hypothetical protein